MKEEDAEGFTEVCIVGLGPAGLGAALQFSESALASSTTCIEAGPSVFERACSILKGGNCRWAQPCEIIGGVGGSALLSSGKVSEYPAGRALATFFPSDAEMQESLEIALKTFESYVPIERDSSTAVEIKEIRADFKSKGFDFRYYPSHRFRSRDLIRGLEGIVSNLTSKGMTIHTRTQVTNIAKHRDGFTLTLKSASLGVSAIHAKRVLLATGRLGLDLVRDTAHTMQLQSDANRFDVGVRLEFPTDQWPDIDRCHNDLKLHFGDTRTFCVCKDGRLAPYRLGNTFLMEGHSEPGFPTGFTNLALMLRVQPSNDDPIFEIVRERVARESQGWPVREMLRDYLGEGRNGDAPRPASSITFWKWGRVSNCFPEDIGRLLRESVRQFCVAFFGDSQWPAISVFGPELDFFWRQYKLHSTFESSQPGLYIIGDAGGHFRGILQSFCSGLVSARRLRGL